MICTRCQRRPCRLSGRAQTCIVCAYLVRVANAVASKIEREFKRAQLRQLLARKAGGVTSILLAVLFVGVFTYAITRWVYRRMLASETRKAEKQRQTFDKIMQASHKPPMAAGWPHRRVS